MLSSLFTLSHRFNSVLNRFQSSLQPIPDVFDKPLCLAVSGGPDSMALAHLTSKLYSQQQQDRPLKHKLHALIINHNLKQGSKEEARKTAKQLKDLNIMPHILDIDWAGDPPETRIQELCREKRYELLYKGSKYLGSPYLLTGHNFSDQLETVLQRFFRHSGLSGLSGMSFQQKSNPWTQLIRPLLSVSKNVLTEYCNDHNIDYISDLANTDSKFFRSRTRQLIESNTLPFDIMSNFYFSNLTWLRTIESSVNEALFHSISMQHVRFGYVSLSPFIFEHLDNFTGMRLINRLCLSFGSSRHTPTLGKLEKSYTSFMEWIQDAKSTFYGLIVSQKTKLSHRSVRRIQPYFVGQKKLWLPGSSHISMHIQHKLLKPVTNESTIGTQSIQYSNKEKSKHLSNLSIPSHGSLFFRGYQDYFDPPQFPGWGLYLKKRSFVLSNCLFSFSSDTGKLIVTREHQNDPKKVSINLSEPFFFDNRFEIVLTNPLSKNSKKDNKRLSRYLPTGNRTESGTGTGAGTESDIVLPKNSWSRLISNIENLAVVPSFLQDLINGIFPSDSPLIKQFFDDTHQEFTVSYCDPTQWKQLVDFNPELKYLARSLPQHVRLPLIYDHSGPLVFPHFPQVPIQRNVKKYFVSIDFHSVLFETTPPRPQKPLTIYSP